MDRGDQLYLVYFFYGLSFLVLGVLLIAQNAQRGGEPQTVRSGPSRALIENLWFLGMFSVLHGLNEWVDMSLLSDAWVRLESAMEIVSSFLYAMSTLCLFEFGISMLTAGRPRIHWLRWLPICAFLFWLGLLFVGALQHWTLPTLEARGWVRYCLGLTGGLLTGFALLTQRAVLASATLDGDGQWAGSTGQRLRKLLVVAAIFFGINAFLSTMVAAESSVMAVGGPGTNGPLGVLLGRIGLTNPLALFRALCAVVICFSVIQALLAIDREQNRQLLEHQRSLEEANQSLRESYLQLQETQQQLVQSEKMSAVGTLVSGIAHEFNNVLSGLKGYTQLARASNDLEQVHKDLEIIEEAANRTIEITRNLLTWVRPERRRAEIIDPNEVIRQAVVLVSSTFTKRNVKIDVALDPVPGVALSKAEVQDIIMNLIINAAHAVPEGRDGRVEVRSTLRDEKTLQITVADNGCGIPPENLEKIFLPFFTTKGALGRSDTPGTGLGLYVAYGVVKQAGGDVRVESEVGKGTKFIITLPALHTVWNDLSSPENPEVEVEVNNILSRMDVLVVEDEALLRDELLRHLKPRTRSVQAASNGREAIKLAATTSFDLVFLDLLMPGISGLETLRSIREYSPTTPVVLMTQKPDDKIRTQVMSRGATGLIHKPFEPLELAEVVRAAARGPVRRSMA